MQDFEPYFCIVEDCNTPFDIPNSFNGLLAHLQEHLPLTWHAELPGGETKEFDDEVLFTNYVTENGGVSGDALAIMKETSLRRTAFLFTTCPFCGGYPDVLEKNYPDPAQPDAQLALRRHIKQHMHDIALFLPPYRDDILEDCGEFNSSAVTRRRSINVNDSSGSSEQPTIGHKENCDCKDRGKDSTDHDLISQDPPVEIDFWPSLLRDSGLYDRSVGLDEDWKLDTCLKPFVTRFLDKPDNLNAADQSATSERSRTRSFDGGAEGVGSSGGHGDGGRGPHGDYGHGGNGRGSDNLGENLGENLGDDRAGSGGIGTAPGGPAGRGSTGQNVPQEPFVSYLPTNLAVLAVIPPWPRRKYTDMQDLTPAPERRANLRASQILPGQEPWPL